MLNRFYCNVKAVLLFKKILQAVNLCHITNVVYFLM